MVVMCYVGIEDGFRGKQKKRTKILYRDIHFIYIFKQSHQ